MGGNALKHLNVQRVLAADYFALVNKVSHAFNQAFNQTPVLVPSYASKPDFGDVDMIVVGDTLPQDWQTQFATRMNSRGLICNGDVSSIEIEQVQFDFISCAAQDLEWNCTYFAYNDLSNLMGRIASAMQFKLGHYGLMYVLRDEQRDHVLANIHIDATPADVFDFLGYDHTRWCQGFNTLEDIFEFAASSTWFHPEIYLLHNLNHARRIRDAKRKTYKAFLQWCEQHAARLPTFDWHSNPSAIHAQQLQRARQRWPMLDTAIHQAQQQVLEHAKLKTIWNGQNVQQWTGLSGKALGEFMTKAREHPRFAQAAQSLESLQALVCELHANT